MKDIVHAGITQVLGTSRPQNTGVGYMYDMYAYVT